MNKCEEYMLKLDKLESEDFETLKKHELDVSYLLTAKFGNKTFFISCRRDMMELTYYLLILNDKLERQQLVIAKNYEEFHELLNNYINVYENE